jgi:hypothetical protein
MQYKLRVGTLVCSGTDKQAGVERKHEADRKDSDHIAATATVRALLQDERWRNSQHATSDDKNAKAMPL